MHATLCQGTLQVPFYSTVFLQYLIHKCSADLRLFFYINRDFPFSVTGHVGQDNLSSSQVQRNKQAVMAGWNLNMDWSDQYMRKKRMK